VEVLTNLNNLERTTHIHGTAADVTGKARTSRGFQRTKIVAEADRVKGLAT